MSFLKLLLWFNWTFHRAIVFCNIWKKASNADGFYVVFLLTRDQDKFLLTELYELVHSQYSTFNPRVYVYMCFCMQEADNGSPLVVNGKVYGLFAGYSGAFNSTSRLYANIPVVAKWIETTINQWEKSKFNCKTQGQRQKGIIKAVVSSHNNFIHCFSQLVWML